MQRFLKLVLVVASIRIAVGAQVSVERLPEGGIQPQVAQGKDGTAHVVYFKGNSAAADLYYMRKAAGAAEFSEPIRVNTEPGSGIAVGTIRGAHIALGKGDRVHIAWMGGNGARKVMIDGQEQTPMVYTRMGDNGKFERERNVLTKYGTLDGGGAIAADGLGNVFVTWHGTADNKIGEAGRGVYLARSTDEGRTFAPEYKVSPPDSGVCACCGMGAFVDSKEFLYILYRSVLEKTNRDEVLLVSRDNGESFRQASADRWVIGMCPMSSAALAEDSSMTYGAWENAGVIKFAALEKKSTGTPKIFTVPGESKRKHPVIVSNGSGKLLLAWTEGTGWQKGGTVHWQIFDTGGTPIGEAKNAPDLPVWGLIAAYKTPDGGFSILY